jgi:hypothetical protein
MRRLIILALIVLGATSCEVKIRPPSEEGTVFAAIQWHDPDQAIDVVFIPDDDYGDLSVEANLQDFLDDVANLIDEGYWQNCALAYNLGGFNFWFMTLTGDVRPPAEGICPDVDWPDLDDVAFAEVKVLIHPNELRDCSFAEGTTTEPSGYRTVVHESTHAAFVMPDEYCCDGGYWELPPILYDTADDCNDDAQNADWRDCECFTDNSGEDWCRSEDSISDIMSRGGATVWEYGPADWVIVGDVLGGLGLGAPAEPEVFAPDAWDWP